MHAHQVRRSVWLMVLMAVCRPCVRQHEPKPYQVAGTLTHVKPSNIDKVQKDVKHSSGWAGMASIQGFIVCHAAEFTSLSCSSCLSSFMMPVL